MDPQRSLKLAGLGAATLLILATILEVSSDLLNLFSRFHLLPVLVAFLGAAGLVACFLMWRSYSVAIREAAEGGGRDLALGLPRSELVKRIQAMTDKPKIKEIDIGGLALRVVFFKRDGQFSEWLLGFLRENKSAIVRVWLLDPNSAVSALREMAERGRKEGNLHVACRESLETLKDLVLTMWKEQRKRRPEVVLVNQVAISQFIFRVDDQMLVSPYLQHRTGNESPTFCLRESNPWFNVYKKEFERCFEMHRGNPYPPNEDLS